MKEDGIHYNLDKLDNENCLFNLIYGAKSKGKSYQLKHKKAVEYYLKTGKRFILLRRWKDEVTTSKVEGYFSDVDIEKLTDGRYNTIIAWRGAIYFGFFDVENFKKVKGEKIGYYIALSQEQNYSSVSFLDVDNIIFEEFMSRTLYIAKEPDKLMMFYDTVDRKRGTTRLWLLGNTVSRVCPYLGSWNLRSTMLKQNAGDIDVIEIKNSNNSIKFGIELTSKPQEKSYAIGDSDKMVGSGEWLTNIQPHLDESLKHYRTVLHIVFVYQDFKFLARLLVNNNTGTLNWFICPKYSEIKPKTLVVGLIKEGMYYNKNIYNLNKRINPKLRDLIDKTFCESNIFYATDLCGTDFKQCIDFIIKK